MSQVEFIKIERKRSFTPEQRAALLAEAQESSMAIVAKKYGIARSLLHKWRSGEIGSVASAPVPFTALTPSCSSSGSLPPALASGIRVEIAGGVAVVFPPGIDLRELAFFVRALGARP